MKDRNMNQWVEGILADKKRIAIPIMTHPGIELIGKTVYQAVSDGRVHFEAIKALNDKYPSAACSVIMDLTVEAEAFGAKSISRKMRFLMLSDVCLLIMMRWKGWRFLI